VPPGEGRKRHERIGGRERVGKVDAVPIDLSNFSQPSSVDVFFTSQNLHDLPTPSWVNVDITAFSKQVY
jgi:hypothetical protein